MNKLTVTILAALAVLFFVNPAVYAYSSNIVTEFVVEGNRMIDDKLILMNIATKIGDRFNAEAVQNDIAKIGEMGYFSYVGAEAVPYKNGQKIVFHVEENEIIGEISIKGCTTVEDRILKDAMESKIGTVFNSKLLSQDIRHLNEALAKQGFLFSKVVDAYVQDKGRKINVKIVEGFLTEIRIEGLKQTKEKVVRRELSAKPGEIYDNKKIVRDLQRIYNLGFFSEVRRDHLPADNPDDVILVIHLVEQKTGRAGAGGGYSSLNGLVGFVTLSQDNLNGTGRRAYIRTEFGGVENYELGYFDPWFRDKPQSFGLDLYNTEYTRNLYSSGSTINEYDERRRGGALTLGRRLTRDTDLSFRFRDEDVELTPTSSTTPMPAGAVNGRSQTLSVIYDTDTRNNRFKPSKGVHDTFWVETTGGFLKGANQYTKYMLALRRYYPIGYSDKTVFAVQGVYGDTEVGSGFVPVYDMFSVGGSNSVRGYEEREFLGTRIFYANFELRHNLSDNFVLVAFYDTGSAWGDDYNKNPIDYDNKSGYGIGFRVHTPIGPIAVDYGKADDRDSGETYINFGSSF